MKQTWISLRLITGRPISQSSGLEATKPSDLYESSLNSKIHDGDHDLPLLTIADVL